MLLLNCPRQAQQRENNLHCLPQKSVFKSPLAHGQLVSVIHEWKALFVDQCKLAGCYCFLSKQIATKFFNENHDDNEQTIWLNQVSSHDNWSFECNLHELLLLSLLCVLFRDKNNNTFAFRNSCCNISPWKKCVWPYLLSMFIHKQTCLHVCRNLLKPFAWLLWDGKKWYIDDYGAIIINVGKPASNIMIALAARNLSSS